MFTFFKNLLILYLVSGIITFVAIYAFTRSVEKGEMTYNKAFTSHFFIMVFLFIVPAISSVYKRSFGKGEQKLK